MKTPTIYQKEYYKLLKDPRWQKKRLEIMERDEFKCTKCRDYATTLNVHHKIYKNGVKPWEYENEDLATVCEQCHSLIESLKRAPDFLQTPFDDIIVYKTHYLNPRTVFIILKEGVAVRYFNKNGIEETPLYFKDKSELKIISKIFSMGSERAKK